MLTEQQRAEETFQVCREVRSPGYKEVHVWVGASCVAARKIGGWAYRPVIDDQVAHKDGRAVGHMTSANRMVLMGVVHEVAHGGKVCRRQHHRYCACAYICRGGNEWCVRWNQENWSGIRHPDLWKIIYAIAHEPYRKVGMKYEPRYKVRFEHVSGATGNPHFAAARLRSRAQVRSQHRARLNLKEPTAA